MILTVFLIIVLVALIGWSVFMNIPAYTGVLVINTLTGSLRSCGPGLQLIWPWEQIVANSETELKKQSHNFENDFETKDKSTLSLKISFDFSPLESHLEEYQRFNSADRLAGITERLKSILAIIIHEYEDRGSVMEKQDVISKEAKNRFEKALSEDGRPLQEYYGVNLKALVIADVGLPQLLKDAQTQREATVKQNETRELEMKKLKEMARALVNESKKAGAGKEMPFEKAMEIIQLQFGKNVEKKIHLYGLDRGTQLALVEIIKEVFHGTPA